MMRWVLAHLLLCYTLSGPVLSAPTKGEGPGGLFEERLRAAERARSTRKVTIRTAPTRTRPVTKRPATRRPATARATVRRPVAQRPQVARRTGSTARRVAVQPRRAQRNQVVSARAGTGFRSDTRSRATPARAPQRIATTQRSRSLRATRMTRGSLRMGEVSFSVDPRNRSLSNVDPTGDIVLFANAASPVRYRWERQKKVTRQPLVLKGYLPQMLKVTAETSSPRGGTTRAESWVPVRANCITTVRFNLQ